MSDGTHMLDDFGRYQVQMNGKGAIIKMLNVDTESQIKDCFSGRFCW